MTDLTGHGERIDVHVEGLDEGSIAHKVGKFTYNLCWSLNAATELIPCTNWPLENEWAVGR